jgi:O-antigen ligase
VRDSVAGMLLATIIFVLFQFVLAIVAPVKFIYFSLWVQTIPYTWNFDAQNTFDTPVGSLAIIAIQLFGFCLACSLVVVSHFERAAAQLRHFKWHVAFLVFCCVSLAYAPSMAYGLRMIAKLTAPFLFMLAILAVVKRESELRNMQTAIFGSGLILVGLALFSRAAGLDVDPNVADTGISGLGPPGMGPPVFSAHMLPVTMLAMAVYVCVPRVSTLIAVIVGAAAIILAFQRTSAAALYLGLAVILFLGTRGIWRLLLPTMGILGLPALIVFSDTFRRRMFFSNESSDALLADPAKALGGVNSSGRFDLWAHVLGRFFQPHPVLGSGVGATQQFLAGRSAAGSGVAHSEYVRLLCEVGVVGLTLFMFAMISYLWRLRRYTAKSNNVPLRVSAFAAIAGLITYLVYCSTDNAFDYVTQFGIYVFGLIAVAEKSHQLACAVAGEARNRLDAPAPLFANLLR